MTRLSYKHCQLTKIGYQKFQTGFYEKYEIVLDDLSDKDLADMLSLDRETYGAIRNGSWIGNRATLKRLFENVGRELEEGVDFNKVVQPIKSLAQTSSIDFHQVRTALTKLDYHEQFGSFMKSFSNTSSAKAFLIHGDSGYGQRWLVNRLSWEIIGDDDQNYSTLIKPLHLLRCHANIQKLWDYIAGEIDSPTSSPDAIIETLYQHMTTQIVILSFYDVHSIAGDCLQQFMNQLWYRLAERVNTSTSDASVNSLYLFLIDDKNYQAQGKLNLILEHYLLELPKLQKFEKSELERWVETQKKLLSQVPNESIKSISKGITNPNLTPEDVFRVIFSYFNLDWYIEHNKRLYL